MTVSEATTWAWWAGIYVCAATPGRGYSPMIRYMAETVICLYRLGQLHEALHEARHWLAQGRAYGGYRHSRQARLLLIFLRRLTRHVDGYVAPRCGRCSDTGVEWRVRRPDCWPIACRSCQPDAWRREARP